MVRAGGLSSRRLAGSRPVGVTMNYVDFFYDESVDDFVPVFDLNLITVEVKAETRQLNASWMREAVDDLAQSIDRDIIRRIIEIGELELEPE